MSRIIILDTSLLGHLTRRMGQNTDSDTCRTWFKAMVSSGARVHLPEIADYELRRELIRSGKTASLQRLDALVTVTEYLPLTTAAMRLAAELWAQARNQGWATADPKALDGDVILAAQTLTLIAEPTDIVVATENVAHLSRYVTAENWRLITP